MPPQNERFSGELSDQNGGTEEREELSADLKELAVKRVIHLGIDGLVLADEICDHPDSRLEEAIFFGGESRSSKDGSGLPPP